MKKLLLFILLITFLVGCNSNSNCNSEMTNDEIIETLKICKNNNLKPHILVSTSTDAIVTIQCEPK